MLDNPPDCAGGTFALISLGCPKNLIDSERMLGRLRLGDYRMVDAPNGADFVVINTCGFIDVARQESCGIIEEMIRLKRQGRVGGLIVTGCLAERDKEKLLEKYPEIDQLLGVFGRDEIAAAAGRVLSGSTDRRMVFPPVAVKAMDDRERLRITVAHLAFLKIAEGCNRLCSFCSIPKLRGRHVSKPIEQVLAEAEELAADGVRELVIVAQDTTYYGIDLYGRPRLADLLKRLDRVDGLEWIRLMYLYPTNITDELIEVVASGRKILAYIDLPIQHISDPVLRRMRRRVNRAETERLIDRLRRGIDNLVLRTTLMAGFPGETEQQFEELVRFVEQRRFERLGVFDYRREPGTPSARLDGQLSEGLKKSRRDRLLAVQQPIAFSWANSQVGRRLDVLLDRDIPGEKNAYVGRSHADAPDVDPVVYVTGEDLSPGRIVPCEIVASRDYDLIGVVVGDPR